MPNMLFANNANTTLNGGITAVATSMVVTSATGFPSPTGAQYFYCTLADAATQTTIEIVKVTAVSGTTFTIVRGQDGTTGTIFASGAVVSLRLVRASLNDFPKLDEDNIFTGNISTNNLLNGYTAVTSAAGTTTLTTASTYYQKLTGTLAQTFQLPDATSLPLGFSFVFDNDSTGVLTINDGSAALVDAVPAGNISYVFLETAGTVAGSWGKYSYVPAAVNIPITGTLLSSTTAPAANPITGTPTVNTYLSGNGTWATLGTGVATALAVNTGSAGAMVLFNGALGTPSSGTVTNLTGTASININGTVGATTATTGVFTTSTANSFIPNSATVPTNGMYLPAANSVGFSTASTARMQIGATGGVSIGNTTDPGATNLSVAGTGAFGSSISATASSASSVEGVFTNTNTGASASAGIRAIANSTGYYALRQYGTGVTATAFGLTIANYALLFTDGASSNGL